ncbi:MAG: transglycosylase domain-containing protein [Acetobacteraceae bacterium]
MGRAVPGDAASPPGRVAWRTARRIAWAAVLVVIAALALDRAVPPDLSRAAPGTEVRDRLGRTLSVLPVDGGTWRLAVRPEEVSRDLLNLLVAAEDRRFYAHPGVDPLALLRAAGQWAANGRVVSGGSTLTMQVARLLEPRPRTVLSKAIEILRAVQLEWRFSKDEILALWLTLAPQGGNLEGVRAGAFAWFGRGPETLSVPEAALLLALARQPSLRPDRQPEAARAARDGVLEARTAGAAGITEADRLAALAAELPRARRPMPALAPHLARELAAARAATTPGPRPGGDPEAQGPGRANPPGVAPPRMAGAGRVPPQTARPPPPRIATTLDASLQRAAERLLADALHGLPPQASAALLIADHGSGEIRALVGGAFGEEARAGSLDLTRAVRSPGSALKPALFGLAFDLGLVRPGTLLADLPERFGAYAPENFDGGFAGRITAADALRRSLNLPAVALLARLGPGEFAAWLGRAGAAPRLPRGGDASLPLALGGAGVTLRELAGLYAALGAGGVAVRLSALPGEGGHGERLISARAAREVAAVLARPFPFGGPDGIAWKTGTSWGGRDAVAAGFDGRHVVAAWVGRPDGTPIPGATGASLALPLLARGFALLPRAPLEGERFAPLAAAAPPPADRLRLLFPPPGARLAAGEGPLVIRVAGGRRPLTFLVDGAPIESRPAMRDAAWMPPGPGFHRITVLDADGMAASADVRFEAREAARLSGPR